jgi:hypothetical protein
MPELLLDPGDAPAPRGAPEELDGEDDIRTIRVVRCNLERAHHTPLYGPPVEGRGAPASQDHAARPIGVQPILVKRETEGCSRVLRPDDPVRYEAPDEPKEIDRVFDGDPHILIGSGSSMSRKEKKRRPRDVGVGA